MPSEKRQKSVNLFILSLFELVVHLDILKKPLNFTKKAKVTKIFSFAESAEFFNLNGFLKQATLEKA